MATGCGSVIVRHIKIYGLIFLFVMGVAILVGTLWWGYDKDGELINRSLEYHLTTIHDLDEIAEAVRSVTDQQHHLNSLGGKIDYEQLDVVLRATLRNIQERQNRYKGERFEIAIRDLSAVLEKFHEQLATFDFNKNLLDFFETQANSLNAAIQKLKTLHINAYKRLFNEADFQRQSFLYIAFIIGPMLIIVGWLTVKEWRRLSLENIETLKETQKKNAQSENWLRAVIENTAEGMIIINDRGKIISFNNAACKTFGYAANEVIGHNVSMLMPENERDQHDVYVRQSDIVAPRIINQSRDLFGLRKNGSTFPMSLNVSLMEREGGKTFIGIMRDISERFEADKMKAEFVSTVSHELRTPLTSIKGALGLMRSGAVGDVPDAAKSMLEIAYNNSERLTVLINDILDLEKIEAGKMNYHPILMDLTALVKTSLIDNKSYADEYGVTFKGVDLNDAIIVYGDANRLMQVMANLLSNAAKFSDHGDDVVISMSRQDDTVRVSIKDNGPGIPENFKEKIFTKFTQADGADDRAKGGTGLGLNIAQAIAEYHGGMIGFDSVLGEGACFYLGLPVHNEKQIVVQEKTTLTKNATILICEDDVDIATFLSVLLNGAGYQTKTATSAEAAKTMLMAEQFDAMTLDLGLPGQDGISFIRDLRQNASTHELPIVVVSANALDGKAELNGPAIQVIDWMQKPVDTEILIQRLDESLGDPASSKAKILHVEDDESVLEIVSVLIGDMTLVDTATTLADAKQLLEQNTYDLVILDLMLPDGRGESLLPFLVRPGQSTTPVIVFSSVDKADDVVNTVNTVLVKSQTSNEQLLDVIRSIILET